MICSSVSSYFPLLCFGCCMFHVIPWFFSIYVSTTICFSMSKIMWTWMFLQCFSKLLVFTFYWFVYVTENKCFSIPLAISPTSMLFWILHLLLHAFAVVVLLLLLIVMHKKKDQIYYIIVWYKTLTGLLLIMPAGSQGSNRSPPFLFVLDQLLNGTTGVP